MSSPLPIGVVNAPSPTLSPPLLLEPTRPQIAIRPGSPDLVQTGLTTEPLRFDPVGLPDLLDEVPLPATPAEPVGQYSQTAGEPRRIVGPGARAYPFGDILGDNCRRTRFEPSGQRRENSCTTAGSQW